MTYKLLRIKSKIKKILSTTFFSLAFIYTNNAYSLSPQTAAHTINKIEIDTRFNPPQIQIYVNEAITEKENCTNSHRYAFSYDEGGQAMLSLLLTAKASGNSVQFNLDGCQDGVPKIKITTLN